jgi:hypothetical protein
MSTESSDETYETYSDTESRWIIAAADTVSPKSVVVGMTPSCRDSVPLTEGMILIPPTNRVGYGCIVCIPLSTGRGCAHRRKSAN